MNQIPVMYRNNGNLFGVKKSGNKVNIFCLEKLTFCNEYVDTDIIIEFNREVESTICLWNNKRNRYFPFSPIRFFIQDKMYFDKGDVICTIDFYNDDFIYNPHLIEIIK